MAAETSDKQALIERLAVTLERLAEAEAERDRLREERDELRGFVSMVLDQHCGECGWHRVQTNATRIAATWNHTAAALEATEAQEEEA